MLTDGTEPRTKLNYTFLVAEKETQNDFKQKQFFRNEKSGRPCSLSISLGPARPNIYSIIFANCYNYQGWDRDTINT